MRIQFSNLEIALTPLSIAIFFQTTASGATRPEFCSQQNSECIRGCPFVVGTSRNGQTMEGCQRTCAE
jgi:hypothetical protein